MNYPDTVPDHMECARLTPLILPYARRVVGLDYGPDIVGWLGDVWGRWVRTPAGEWVVVRVDAAEDRAYPADMALVEAVRAATEKLQGGALMEPAYLIWRDFATDLGRYFFDFRACTYGLGWCQVDTPQDYAHLGHWLHPERLELVSYCENDITRWCFPTPEDLELVLRDVEHLHESVQIDPGLDPAMRTRLKALGLGRWVTKAHHQ
jgi:hypothetical protein